MLKDGIREIICAYEHTTVSSIKGRSFLNIFYHGLFLQSCGCLSVIDTLSVIACVRQNGVIHYCLIILDIRLILIISKSRISTFLNVTNVIRLPDDSLGFPSETLFYFSVERLFLR